MKIEEVVDLLGLSYDTRGDALMMVCPLPDHADTVASFKVFTDEDRFFCFGCEARGDLLDLYAQVREISKEAATDEIRKLTGETVGFVPPRSHQPEREARQIGERALEQLHRKIPIETHAALGERLDKICWAYRKKLIEADQLKKAIARYVCELPAVP